MDLQISLTDVRFFAYHGVFDFEKVKGNEFIVNLSVSIPWNSKVEDNLEHTISYAELYDVVKEEMDIVSDLIETVATRIRNRLLSTWPQINAGFVEIIKTRPPIPGFSGKASVKLNFF